MKILIIGAGGMLGSDVVNSLSDQDLIVADLPEWDITKFEDLKQKVDNCQLDYIINCAAFTNVGKAEEKETEVFKVNAQGPLNLAKISSNLNIPLIHISTDYVFNGEKKGGYDENDQTGAISVYGKSKEAGEKNVAENCQKYFIIRTSGLFGKTLQKGEQGRMNFVDKMLELGQNQKSVTAVSDKFSKPTYTKDLAKLIRDIIETKPEYGIYHGVNEGVASWHQFAKEVFKQAGIKTKLKKTTCLEFFKNNIRPKYSALNNNKLPKLRNWKEALTDYLKSIQAI